MGNPTCTISDIEGSKSEHYGLMEMHLSKWQHRQNSQMNHWWIWRCNKNANRRKIRCLLHDEMYCCCCCYFYCSVRLPFSAALPLYFMFLFCEFFILFFSHMHLVLFYWTNMFLRVKSGWIPAAAKLNVIKYCSGWLQLLQCFHPCRI